MCCVRYHDLAVVRVMQTLRMQQRGAGGVGLLITGSGVESLLGTSTKGAIHSGAAVRHPPLPHVARGLQQRGR
jgi:hypothetical protein